MKVVLAYSGGLDTSVMIPWLKEEYGCQVIAYLADVGQKEDISAARRKALKTGAAKVIVEDLKASFVKDYVFPTLAAGAVYEGKYLLGTSMARPCIARGQVKAAEAEKADAVAHGCTGKGNDQVRFEMAYMTLAPHLKIIAPWREWTLKSRSEEIEYALSRGIPVGSGKKTYSMDKNLWHGSIEGGELEDLTKVLPEKAYQLTKDPRKAPAAGAKVRIAFVSGRPVRVNGRKLAPAALLEALNRLGGAHGVGRTDMVENRLVGMKSRGVYETPGGTLLVAALAELCSIAMDRETFRFRSHVSVRYADLVYNGQWFTPLREALDAFVAKAMERITGEVKLHVCRGAVTVLERRSVNALYRASLATFEEGEAYDQRHSEGFIRLFNLPYPKRGGG